jgi:hypothetical protein
MRSHYSSDAVDDNTTTAATSLLPPIINLDESGACLAVKTASSDRVLRSYGSIGTHLAIAGKRSVMVVAWSVEQQFGTFVSFLRGDIL